MRPIYEEESMNWTSRQRPDLQVRIGGALWALSLVYFAGQGVAQAAWTAPYSLIDNRISDLGATACGPELGTYICSPMHALMNVTFVVTGALLLIGLLLTRRAWPRRKLTAWGFAFLAVAGAGTILVGLNPENVNLGLHVVGALNIPCGSLGLLLLGLATWESRPGVSKLTLLLAGIGFAGMVGGIAVGVLGGHGAGLAERLALYPAVLWTALVGGWLTWRPGVTSASFALRSRAS